MQIQALKDYGVHEDMIFTDKMSGATRKRPGLHKALRMAVTFQTEFVVWKIDRLGRTVVGITDIVRIFDDNDVKLHSLTEGFDLGTPFGRAIFHIMATMAQMERDQIKERTIAGLAAARERGVKVGRKETMTPERAEKAIEMIRTESTVKEIIEELNKLEGPPIGRSKVYKWIKEYKERIGPDDPMYDR